jgi:uncharacterized membrane protein YwaF
MGPWPWYVIGLVLLCAIACLVAYAPFPVARKIQRIKFDKRKNK